MQWLILHILDGDIIGAGTPAVFRVIDFALSVQTSIYVFDVYRAVYRDILL